MEPETSILLKSILTEAVESGTGKKARIKGMPIAGKTGTAQLIDFERGGYFRDRFMASFVGFFPSISPRYLMIICVEEFSKIFRSSLQMNQRNYLVQSRKKNMRKSSCTLIR